MNSRIFILYDSKGGTTQKIAEVVAQGARRIAGVTVELKKVDSVTPQDMIDADG
jgi:NAD(P)H dehydrogenase (quinone)